MENKQNTKSDAPDTEQTQKPEASKSPDKANLIMTRRGFEPRTIEEASRFARALSESDMVPDRYRGKPRDCLIALDLAARLNTSWLAVMQHVYSVKGRLAMDAALVTSLVNQSGMFVDPLEYEVEGDVKDKKNFRVRAYATRKSTGTVLYGPWIDWDLVQAEGWDRDMKTRDGSIIKSKWNTMSEQMFHYRAAAWFQRRHCPEVTMGMLTTEEAYEIEPKHVDSKVIEEGIDELKKRVQTEQGSEPIDDSCEEKKDDSLEEGVDEEWLEDDEKEEAEKVKKKRGRPKKQKDTKPIYHCHNCGRDFDKVNAEDKSKGWQCPNCLSWRVGLNKEQEEAA